MRKLTAISAPTRRERLEYRRERLLRNLLAVLTGIMWVVLATALAVTITAMHSLGGCAHEISRLQFGV